MNFQKYFEGMNSLVAFVEADPRLADFLPRLRELREQSRLVAQGRKDVAVLPPPSENLIVPDRATAEAMLTKINALPFCEPEREDAETLRIFHRLSMNLVSAVFHAIKGSFPELVSRDGPSPRGS